MLVIISDLHFCDGTATPRNISPNAFGLLLDDLYDLAEGYRAASLDIVFLGDVIDLLRTERWFEVPIDSRPWGGDDPADSATPPASTLAQARAIAASVIAENAAALRSLRGEDVGRAPPCPVRRIFLPGNHDRLYLHDDGLRSLVRDALGATDERTLGSEGIFQHHLLSPRYGLLARHGHEWDVWNFERFRDDAVAADYRAEDYLYTPIGDPITTELVARLPYELKRELSQMDEFRGTPELEDIYLRMQRIEDVRPVTASFRWVFHQAGRIHGELVASQAAALSRGLRETSRRIAADFQSLRYYRAWREVNHRLFRLDAANKLALVLDLIEHVDLGHVAAFIDKYQALFDKVEDDDTCRKGALKENLSSLGNSGSRFVVYGHTHEPLQVALHADGTRDVYLNSGTWRQRQLLAEDGSGFIDVEMFTYCVFVDRKETQDGSDRGAPAFISWNGARRV